MIADREFRGYASHELTLGGEPQGLVTAARSPQPDSPWRSTLSLRSYRERAAGGAAERGPAYRTKGIRMDHRQGARFRAFRLVELEFDDADRAGGLLYNISRNGMFILTTVGVDINHCVDIHIPAANENDMVRISAMVVHSSNCGLGLIFRELDGAAEAAVEEFCAWR